MKPGPKPKGPQPCSVDACPRPRRARGMCNTHYDRWKRGLMDWNAAVPVNELGHGVICAVPLCGRKRMAKGLCSTHWDRKFRQKKADWNSKPIGNNDPRKGDWSGIRRVWSKREVMAEVEKYASFRGLKPADAVGEILERWFQGVKSHRKGFESDSLEEHARRWAQVPDYEPMGVVV
jgi:hypothetical protein